MKKIAAALLLATMLLSGCKVSTGSEGRPNEVPNTNEASNMEKVEFSEIESLGIDWDEIGLPVDPKEVILPANVNSISTKEDAIIIGQAIIENHWNNNRLLDHVLISVVHSTKDNIWFFEYSIDQRDKNVEELMECGGFYVAIDGNTGEIVKAWLDD